VVRLRWVTSPPSATAAVAIDKPFPEAYVRPPAPASERRAQEDAMASDSDLQERLNVLEARLHLLEDDKAMRELLARYGYNADQGRSEAYVQLFTEDGALDLTSGPGRVDHGLMPPSGPPPDREVVMRHGGQDALRRFITDSKGHKAIEGNCLHFMGNNLTTEISGDSAIAESYNMTLVRRGAEFILFNAAINRWTLVKRDGKWLIKECFRRRPGTAEFQNVLVTQE
jgi:SnoaL-like domain